MNGTTLFVRRRITVGWFGWLALGGALAGIDGGRLGAQTLSPPVTELRIVTAAAAPVGSAHAPATEGVARDFANRPGLNSTAGPLSPMRNDRHNIRSAASGQSATQTPGTTQRRLVISKPIAAPLRRFGSEVVAGDPPGAWIATSTGRPIGPATPPAEQGWVRLTFHTAGAGTASPARGGQFPEDSARATGDPVVHPFVPSGSSSSGGMHSPPPSAWTSPRPFSAGSASRISPGDSGWSPNPLR